MKIQILSDLHLEYKEYNVNLNKDAEVLVLAGDICPPSMIERFTNMLQGINRDIPILYICGNHEYYNSNIEDVNNFWEDFENVTPNFYFLNNKTKIINGYQFVGSTLWTNFDMALSTGYPRNLFTTRAEQTIEDFAVIRNGNKLFSVEDCITLNITARQFIKNSVDSYVGKSVVITHFVPHSNNLYEDNNDNRTSCYFISNCSELISDNIPLWIFGHAHIAKDIMVENTRMICNPRGYPGENSKYNPLLTVDLL